MEISSFWYKGETNFLSPWLFPSGFNSKNWVKFFQQNAINVFPLICLSSHLYVTMSLKLIRPSRTHVWTPQVLFCINATYHFFLYLVLKLALWLSILEVRSLLDGHYESYLLSHYPQNSRNTYIWRKIEK